jgi:Cu(I)/Ag(I) efflux system membrane fusion protein
MNQPVRGRLPITMAAATLAAVLLAGGAFLAGRWSAAPGTTATTDDPHAGTADAGDDGHRVLYWYDPMRPDQHFPAPGRSPFMDMALVPKYADAADAGVVRIDPRVAQNLGVRVARAVRRPWQPRVVAAGSVEVDERRIVAVEARTAAFVERLHVRAAGERVVAGEALATLYAPEADAARAELALAERLEDDALIAAARLRVAALGLDVPGTVPIARKGSGGAEARYVDAAGTGSNAAGAGVAGSDASREGGEGGLRGMAGQRTRLLAPIGGIVVDLPVREGVAIGPGTPLLRLADLSQVWIGIDVPVDEATWLAPGLGAEVRLAGLPGRSFDGEVEYVYPQVAGSTRTVRARVTLPNPGGMLKPGMYATVTLTGAPQPPAVLVPTAALIRTGSRSVVFVATANDGTAAAEATVVPPTAEAAATPAATGTFRAVHVVTGAETGDRTVVTQGLAGDEQVVVSGQFLIDSEASLRGAFMRMGSPGAGAAAATPPGVHGPQDGAAGTPGDAVAAPGPSPATGPTPDSRNRTTGTPGEAAGPPHAAGDAGAVPATPGGARAAHAATGITGPPR